MLSEGPSPVGAAENIGVETEEPSGKDNEIKVIRYLQRKTYIDEMMTDRGRSRDNLAGLKASSRA